jgi:sec-independent protein translocase protein TatA
MSHRTFQCKSFFAYVDTVRSVKTDGGGGGQVDFVCAPFIKSFKESDMIPAASELLVIAGIALLLFGPSKLPQLGSAIGESIRNFRKGMKPKEEEELPPTQTPPTLLAQHSAVPPAQTKIQESTIQPPSNPS